MLNLLEWWKKALAKQPHLEQKFQRYYPYGTKQTAIDFDIKTTYSVFEFPRPPNVIFVKSILTFERVNFYKDLPKIALTQEQENSRLMVTDEQNIENPHYYDGKLIVITHAMYDENANILYLEAKQIPYSWMMTYSEQRFAEASNLYQCVFLKIGVLVPLITRDNVSILLERAQDGLYSVTSGFLEANHENQRLNFKNEAKFIIKTAMAELKEELAGVKDTHQLRFKFSRPKITAISLRKTKGNPLKTMDFIAPSYAECHSSYLEEVVLNPLAESQEHTKNYELIDLDIQKRDKLLTTLMTGARILPGQSLYLPVVESLIRFVDGKI